MSAGWALALTAWLLAQGPPAPAPPLTNEDVVRMLVAGASREEVLEAIHTREVAFDLSPEMVAELRLAGVPEEIVAAMQARERLERARRAPGPPERPAVPQAFLQLEEATGRQTVSLRLPRELPPAAAQALQLQGEDVAIEDAALFVVCLTPEHVPDYWRNASPLGRDFTSMPRHRMLAFLAGARADRKGQLELALPARALLSCPHEDSHDLAAGVAARLGGRFLALSLTPPLEGVSFAGQTLRLRVAPQSRFPYATLELHAAPEEGPPAPGPDQRSSRETTRETPGSSIVTP